MKPFVLLLVLCALSNSNAVAQDPIVNTKRAVGIDNTYTVSRGATTFLVKNEKNKLGAQPTFPKSLGGGDIPWVIMYRTTKLDKGKLLANISAVFSSTRLREMKDEKLILMLYFSDAGDLLEVTFGIFPESKITVKEVNGIENRLKKYLKLEILTDDMKGSSFLPYSNIYYFRDLPETK